MFEAFEKHKEEVHRTRAQVTLQIEDERRPQQSVRGPSKFKGPHLGDLVKEILNDNYTGHEEEDLNGRACHTFEKASDFFAAVRDSSM